MVGYGEGCKYGTRLYLNSCCRDTRARVLSRCAASEDFVLGRVVRETVSSSSGIVQVPGGSTIMWRAEIVFISPSGDLGAGSVWKKDATVRTCLSFIR